MKDKLTMKNIMDKYNKSTKSSTNHKKFFEEYIKKELKIKEEYTAIRIDNKITTRGWKNFIIRNVLQSN